MSQISPAEQASSEALEKLRVCIGNKQCFRLEAGAGAGKTYSLIESIKYLVNDWAEELQRNEQQIACITYTNVAKDEIRNRTDHHPVIFADTIHAFCWSVLQSYQVKLRELIPGLGEKWVERINLVGGVTNQPVKYELGFPSINDSEITLHHDDVIALMAKMLFFPKFQRLLKSKFPIIFIDEYQDTNIRLADSIVSNLIDNDSGVIVGLFGDHWQKIFGSSACGLISSNTGKIIEIGKKANFRSDKNIVECLNRMRPSLPQAESNPQSQGVIKVFHSNSWSGIRRDGKGGGHWKDDLPEENVKEYINRVKELMIGDGWDMSAKNTKILFLTNNLIASEQKFNNLANCYSYPDDFLKKADKYIQFFLDVVEPTIFAFERKEYGELFQIGRKKHPHLRSQADKKNWSDNLNSLAELRTVGTIGEILDFLARSKTPQFPNKVELSEDRYRSILLKKDNNVALDDDETKFFERHHKVRAISYQEVINLGEYIDEKTPFSTKHGVKGAEFDNVLVIFGRGWNHYNWNQMLEWFEDGIPNGEDEKFERNRNLFYVSCSRAKHNLTLLFTQELSTKGLSSIQRIFGEVNVLGNPI